MSTYITHNHTWNVHEINKLYQENIRKCLKVSLAIYDSDDEVIRACSKGVCLPLNSVAWVGNL